MKEKNNANKKKQKNAYTHQLFKFIEDEEFMKSSSKDLSEPISFQKEIRQSDENEKSSNEKKLFKNNKRLIGKIINTKGSTSSSNKIKNAFITTEGDNINNNNNIEEENNKNDKISKIMIMNSSELESNKGSLNPNNNLELNEQKSNTDKEDIKNIINNYVDSSYNSSHINKSKNNIIKIQNGENTSLNLKNISRNRSQNLNSNRSNSSNNQLNKNEKNDESYIESSNDFNTNKNNQGIINLKPLKIILNKNSKKKSDINNSKKASFMNVPTEQDNIKKNNELFNRNKFKRISQREFSMKSSNHSYNKEKKNNTSKINIFIVKRLINIPFLIIMIIMNIFSLFSSDVRNIWLSKKVDIYFDIINLISILYFILEIIILCFLDEAYLNSFIFWIDTIGAICIIFNVEMLTNYIFGYNKINNKSERIINNSIEYIKICIIMLERVIRIAKVVQCLKIYNFIQIINKYKYIFSEKQQRELLKKKNQKQRLIKKIQDIEGEEEIEESVFSNESYLQTRNSTILENDKYREKNEEVEKKDKNILTIKGNSQKKDNEETKTNKDEKIIKRNSTIKKVNKTLLRKESIKSLRSLRQNKNNRNSIPGAVETLNLFNFDENDKKEIEKNEEINEEIYKKIDEIIKNNNITNKVLVSMRKKIKALFIILLLISVILNENLFSGFKNKDKILFYSYIIDTLINNPYNNTTLYNNKIINFLSANKEDDYSIINITKNNNLLYENENLTKYNYRYSELVKISSSSNNNIDTNEVIIIIYSVKNENIIKHIFYLILTVLLCISIILASILSETDLTHILLNPFEIMIELADGVSKDPMNAKNIKELEQGVNALLQKNNNGKNQLFNESIINKSYNECYNSYEVKVIMNSIIKISALLAMSVGEAGGEIIHKNLSSDYGIHLHSRGKKKSAIFGFCNIRDFEEINLALEEETIPLINQIAEIVHSSVDLYRGNTNKNIGDAFLNVWKFYNYMNIKNINDKKLIKDNLLEIDSLNPQINITADCSVLAYLRCILKINKNLSILKYNQNEKLKKKMPKFRINMGFGLHLGYGIEGPVGSIFKMDASYLSPNVNIAARLETATKQFGVSLLISGNLYNLFSEEMKEICRYVDCVMVKGSSEPIDLYTIDINYNVTPQKNEKIKIIKNPEEKTKIFKEKKTMIECLIQEYGSITRVILEKESYWELIDEKTEEFYESWENAIKNYKEGKWQYAKKYFEQCLTEDLNDGPTNTLYNYIKKFNFKSPKDWKGRRELTNK